MEYDRIGKFLEYMKHDGVTVSAAIRDLKLQTSAYIWDLAYSLEETLSVGSEGEADFVPAKKVVMVKLVVPKPFSETGKKGLKTQMFDKRDASLDYNNHPLYTQAPSWAFFAGVRGSFRGSAVGWVGTLVNVIMV
jgi:hypothetical protein